MTKVFKTTWKPGLSSNLLDSPLASGLSPPSLPTLSSAPHPKGSYPYKCRYSNSIHTPLATTSWGLGVNCHKVHFWRRMALGQSSTLFWKWD